MVPLAELDKACELLHEAYEILLEKFQDLCPSYVAPKEPALCRLADRFAAAVLMQPRVFSLFARASGLDVIALQKSYRRSYASGAMRLVEECDNSEGGSGLAAGYRRVRGVVQLKDSWRRAEECWPLCGRKAYWFARDAG